MHAKQQTNKQIEFRIHIIDLCAGKLPTQRASATMLPPEAPVCAAPKTKDVLTAAKTSCATQRFLPSRSFSLAQAHTKKPFVIDEQANATPVCLELHLLLLQIAAAH